MKKLSLNLDALRVQSFETSAGRAAEIGTVQAFAVEKTGLQDTHCSAIDACASSLGCTRLNCDTVDPVACPSAIDRCPTARGCDTYDPALCPSVIDACPSRGCTPVFVC
jgi:hypothetical protein